MRLPSDVDEDIIVEEVELRCDPTDTKEKVRLSTKCFVDLWLMQIMILHFSSHTVTTQKLNNSLVVYFFISITQ